MKVHKESEIDIPSWATEQAYKNGYQKGYEEGFKEGYEGGVDVGKRNAVKHGRWIQCGELDEDGNGQYYCSVCSAGERHNPIVDVPYCWKCGADMRGADHDR